jgi:hypothetical protein
MIKIINGTSTSNKILIPTYNSAASAESSSKRTLPKYVRNSTINVISEPKQLDSALVDSNRCSLLDEIFQTCKLENKASFSFADYDNKRSRSQENVDGLIVGVIQNDDLKPFERTAEIVKINLSSSFSKNEQISAGMSTCDAKVYDVVGARVHEKKHNSLAQRVINRIVEGGKKSKLPQVSKSNEYELINGYETSAEQLKSKKRSASSKSTTLINEPALNSNSKAKIERNKSYSMSASLPSRNFKVVDDLKSLFDKITSSNSHKHHKNKVIHTASAANVEPSPTNATMSAVLYSIESPAHFNAKRHSLKLPEAPATSKSITSLFTNKPSDAENESSARAKPSETQMTSRILTNNQIVKLKMSQSFSSEGELVKRRVHDSFTVIKSPSNPPPISLSTFKASRAPLTMQLRQAEVVMPRLSSIEIVQPVVQVGQVVGEQQQQQQQSPVLNKRVALLKHNMQNSFSSTDAEQDSPESPRKGALKKLSGLRDSSSNRSPLKVRWKDMIEITNVTDEDWDEVAECRNSRSRVKAKIEDDSDEEIEIVDDDDDDDEDMFDDDEDFTDDDADDDDDDEEVDENVNDVYNEKINHIKIKIDKSLESPKVDRELSKLDTKPLFSYNSSIREDSLASDAIITSEKKSYTRKLEGTTQSINLKPLHSTGKEFEKEMSARIERLNEIRVKVDIQSEGDKFYDEIYADLDSVLLELHSTIEHVRLSSMMPQSYDDSGLKEPNSELSKYLIRNIEEKIASVAVICREFVSNSKSMISSALINENEVKPHIRNAMNSLCSLVTQCFETCYNYLYKNEKLDETRQLLIQLLNLLNTFKTTLNITYLASSKQLNDTNMNLLMKQATSLANEISLLIKHFKLLF